METLSIFQHTLGADHCYFGTTLLPSPCWNRSHHPHLALHVSAKQRCALQDSTTKPAQPYFPAVISFYPMHLLHSLQCRRRPQFSCMLKIDVMKRLLRDG